MVLTARMWRIPTLWRRPVAQIKATGLLYQRMATAPASVADKAIESATKVDDVMHHHKNNAV